MVRLRTAGSADYRGKVADARMCDVPEALHVEHLVISRSICIQDRKRLISEFYCKARQFFYDSERLGKADIEEWSGPVGQKKHCIIAENAPLPTNYPTR